MRQSLVGLILVAVAAVGGGALLLSDLGKPKGGPVVVDALARLNPAAIQSLSIRVEGQPAEEEVTLSGGKDGWSMAGNWPVRQAEAKELVDLVGNLRTRFAPERISDEKELARRGLKPAQVSLKVGLGEGAEVKLDLGEEPAGSNAFNRPVWAKLSGSNEVLRLSPGTLTVLKRPASFYRQRRLFAANQEAGRKGGVRNPADGGAVLAPVLAKTIEMKVDNPAGTDGKDAKDALLGGLRLDRAEPAAGNPTAGAVAWRVSSADGKERIDFLDPVAGDAVLANIPEIWAERFYFGEAAAPGKTGLDKPDRTLVVTDLNGKSIKLLVGKRSRERTFKRLVQATPPPGLPPGMQLPPREETVREEYLFAQLADNPQVFEVRADRVNNSFVSRAKIRDPKLARFKTADVEKVLVSGVTQATPVQLAKKDGKWRLIAPYDRAADGAKVESLLGKLEGLEAKDADVDEAEAKDLPAAIAAAGLDKPKVRVELTVSEADPTKAPPAEGEAPKWTRQVVFELGNLDPGTNKLAARSEGLPRINKVDNGLKDQPENQVLTVASRGAGDYRSTQLFDLEVANVTGITVDRPSGKIALKREKGKPWMLENPAGEADAGEVDRLLAAIANVRASEFVADSVPADKQGAEYGLATGAVTVTLTATPDGKPAQTMKLVLGKDRGGKPGSFAKAEVDGNAGGQKPGEALVFAVTPDVRGAVDRDGLAFVPRALWTLNDKDVAAIVIKRPDGSEFKLVPLPPAITPSLEQPQDEGSWKILGPFETQANQKAQGIGRALVAPVAKSWLSLVDDKLPERGLDKPTVVRVELKNGTPKVLWIGKEDPSASTPAPAGTGQKPPLGRFAKVEGKSGVLVVEGSLAQAVDQTALDLVPLPVTNLDPSRILKVDLKRSEKPFSLERSTRGGWQLLGLGDFSVPADSDRAGRLEETLAALKVVKMAAYGKDADTKAKDFGLDKPVVDLVANLKPAAAGKPGETRRVRLGAALPDKSGTYARLDEEPAVIVLDNQNSAQIQAAATEYLNRSLLPKEKLTVTKVTRTGKVGELVLEKQGNGWKATKPEGLAVDAPTLNYLLESLDGLDAQDAEAYQPTWLQADLARYGLDQPEAVWVLDGTVDGKPGQRVVQVGKIADSRKGSRFARADGPLVGRIGPEVANKLVAPSSYFQDRLVAKIGGIREAKVTSGGRTLTFRLDSDRWKVVQPIQAEADQTLAGWLAQFGQFRAGEWIQKKDTPEDRKAVGLEKPVTRWELFGEGNKSLGVLEMAAPGVDGFAVAALTGAPGLFKLDAVQARQAQAEYRIRQVYDPPFDPGRVRRLTVTPEGGKPFVLLQAGSGWFVEADASVKPDPNTVRETLAALSNLRVVRYAVDKGAKLGEFGLDKPYFALELGNTRLLIGKPVSDSAKDRYATLEGFDVGVFVIDERAVELLARPLARFAQPPKDAPPPAPAPAPIPGGLGIPGM